MRKMDDAGPRSLTKILGWLTALALLAVAQGALAQQYPSKRIRILVPFAAGGGVDAVVRVIGEGLSSSLGQPVIIENKPGASGFLAIEELLKAPPDGHDLVAVAHSHLVINPYIYAKLPYSVEGDLAPVALLYKTPFYLAVGTKGKIKSVQDLIAKAKAEPGRITYGTPFIGSPQHLGTSLFEYLTGVQMLHIPFKDTSLLYISVATGEVDWAFGTLATTKSLEQNGRLKLLAVAAKARDSARPDIPTIAEVGGPGGFEVNSWVGLMARRGTPESTIQRLNSEIDRILGEPPVQKRLENLGFDPLPGTPSEFGALIRSDSKLYGEVVRRTGIKAN